MFGICFPVLSFGHRVLSSLLALFFRVDHSVLFVMHSLVLSSPLSCLRIVCALLIFFPVPVSSHARFIPSYSTLPERSAP